MEVLFSVCRVESYSFGCREVVYEWCGLIRECTVVR